jgi:predicted transcriptional regulator
MNAKKRTKTRSFLKILQICNGKGAIITRIACSSNLNFKIILKYINLLVENSSIELVR